MGFSVFFIGYYLNISNLPLLIIQITAGIFLTIVIAECFQMESYLYIKKLTLEKLMN